MITLSGKDILPQTGEDEASPEARRRDEILAAAGTLFLRYGIRRTSMEDVAREAGIAKGTVYLSFSSKEALFAALAERMVERFLADAREAMRAANGLTDAVVAFLDGVIGRPGRLIHESPHTAELMESKFAYASQAFERLYRSAGDVLRERLGKEGIDREDAPAMLLAAAFGCKRTGETDADSYLTRLRSLVETIIAGLRR